jgi:hypothetical protein
VTADFIPKKIGLFHFGSDERRPPCVLLEKSMEDAGGLACLRESIIVLPEAFNIGVKYDQNSDPKDFDFDPGVRCRLMAIAARFECAFVAGLIVRTSESIYPPNNSAYFISGAFYCELSVKTEADQMVDSGAYTASTHVRDSPLELGNTTVSALICLDAYEAPKPHLSSVTNCERHEALRGNVAKIGASSNLLCIPANGEISGIAISRNWPDFHLILANGCCLPPRQRGCADYFPSVVSVRGKEPVEFQEKMNKVIVCSLEA